MKKFLPGLIFLIFGIAVQGQVILSQFPKDLQLYPRDLETNSAQVSVSGSISEAQYSGDSILLKVIRASLVTDTFKSKLEYFDGLAIFNFTAEIKAGLHSYSFELIGVKNGERFSLAKAREVVAGDAFLICGQSNAVALKRQGSSINFTSPFIRTFGHSGGWVEPVVNEDRNWYYAEGDTAYTTGAIGQWGLVLAKWIVDEQQVPVAILNGGLASTPIADHQADPQNPINYYKIYGRLFSRALNSGLQNGIRAIFWYQGEEDGALGTSREEYTQSWQKLRNQWKLNYPSTERIFLFQIKRACNIPVDSLLPIVEAQRQIALTDSEVCIISTNGIPAIDGCHYGFEDGYQVAASRLIHRVSAKLYAGDESSRSVNITQVKLLAPTLIECTFDGEIPQSLVLDPGEFANFRVTGTESLQMTYGCVSGGKLYLITDRMPSAGSRLDYFGGNKIEKPFLHYGENDAALLFADVLIQMAFEDFFRGEVGIEELLNHLKSNRPDLEVNLRKSLEIQEKSLLIIPNPAKSVSRVYLPTGASLLRIFDGLGNGVSIRQISQQEATQSYLDIDVSGFTSGTYTVMILSDDQIKRGRLIVTR